MTDPGVCLPIYLAADVTVFAAIAYILTWQSLLIIARGFNIGHHSSLLLCWIDTSIYFSI